MNTGTFEYIIVSVARSSFVIENQIIVANHVVSLTGCTYEVMATAALARVHIMAFWFASTVKNVA